MSLFIFDVYKYTDTLASQDETQTNKNPTLISVDEHQTNVSAYPVAIPSSSPANHSFECFLKLKVTAFSGLTKIENLEIYGPNTPPGTDVALFLGVTDTYPTNGPVATTSSIATTQVDTSANSPGTAITITTPQALDELTAVGQYTDFIVIQEEVDVDAITGAIPTQVMFLIWDES